MEMGEKSKSKLKIEKFGGIFSENGENGIYRRGFSKTILYFIQYYILHFR